MLKSIGKTCVLDHLETSSSNTLGDGPTGNLRKKRAKFSENEGKAVDDHPQKKPDYLKSIS